MRSSHSTHSITPSEVRTGMGKNKKQKKKKKKNSIAGLASSKENVPYTV